MAIKERVKLGEFEIQNHKRDKGLAYQTHKQVEGHLKSNGLGSYTHVNVEGDKVVVYVDSYTRVLEHAEEVLRGFEAKHLVKGKLLLKYTPIGIDIKEEVNKSALPRRYSELQGQYSTILTRTSELEGTIRDLQSSLDSTETRLAQVEREKSSLEEEYLGVIEQKEQPRALKRSAIPQDLEKIVKENETAFFNVQGALIADVFNQVSEKLESRDIYETPEVEEAKKF